MRVTTFRPFLYLIAVLLLAVVVEAISFVAARILLPTGLLVERQQIDGYEEYMKTRDPVLGWPSPEYFGNKDFDISGSRMIPAFPDESLESCAALYGDSFTWGDEVEAADAYGNVLAEMLGCRVANYGVGGYGTDQAAIRYMQVIEDNAQIVVLGHFSDNIIRNVNQLRDFVAGGRFGFKPRFILENGNLRQVPLPELSAGEYSEVVNRARELLPHEYFQPGSLGAAGIMQFPYTRAVVNTAFHYRMVSALMGIRPTYAPFYRPDHPSGALDVTVELLVEVDAIAQGRGQRFVVLLIPDLYDLRATRAGKSVSYAPLKDALYDAGIELIDSAEYFGANYQGESFCALFVSCGASHFNAAGYRLLAESVYQAIIQHESPDG